MGKQKEIKSSDPLPPVKKQRMTIEFVLIPKHKYEQLEKDTPPNNGGLLEPPLSSPPSLPLPSYTTENNDNQVDSLLDAKKGADDETICNTDVNDDYDASDVLESFNSTELKYVQPIITLIEE